MDEKLKKLEAILKLVDESISRTEFESAIKALVDYVKKVDIRTESELKTITESVKTALQRIETTAHDTTLESSKTLAEKAEKLIDEITFAKEAFLAEAQAKLDAIKDGEDGKDADEERMIERLLAEVPAPKEETGETIANKLETLTGDERLKIDAIHMLREELDRLEKEIKKKNTTVYGGASGVGILDEGVTKSLNARWLNFTGAGVSVSNVGNQTVIQITGGGSGSTTPVQDSGVIADLTTIVTLAHTPYTDTLMLYINEAFVDPSRYSVSGSDEIVMGTPLDASYTGLRYTAIYQYA
jgi:hypothetical protein